MSFGGAIKLTGETEYRRALKQITADLKTTSNALKSQANDFNTNNKSIASTTAKEKELTKAINKSKTVIATAQRSFSQYSVALQAQQTRHNALNKEYKAAVLELDRIKRASGEASDEYRKQAEKVADLEGKLVESTDEMNKNKAAMSDLKREINSATRTMNTAENELNDLGDSAKDSGDKAKKAKEGFTVFKGVIANLASKAITTAIRGLQKLSSATVNVGKQAVASYAEYEQLVGGVETIFKDSADIVKGYAAQSYKTAQISANEYMQTVTSFSASLLQGLNGDTEKAAKIADMAIIDMSDNANKLGTSMEMIQNAYQGFAKDNYTMLDNLKLGYGGTQAEAARLINDTQVMGKEFKATAKNVKDVPFDKFILAIHKVQEEMGITGTSAAEASGTIEGSVNAMKASWSNLLTAIADDNADLEKSVDEFVDSTINAGSNLVPRVKKIVDSIKKLINGVITESFPKLKREIPQLRPLINTFEWFIDHKNIVVGAVGAMVGAFALSKILSFTKGLSDVSKMLIDVARGAAIATISANANTAAEVANTTAKVAATGATGALTAATNLLNAAWKANPVGIVIAGLTALVGVIALVIKSTNKMIEEERAHQQALEDAQKQIEANAEAWADLENAQRNQINVGMTEAHNLNILWDELQGIVDQNGKVKKGYEQRASFITSTLSEALGIEIENTNGVIKGYEKLEKKIGDVIEQKKAQIILDSQEPLYREAIEKQTEAVKNVALAEEARAKKQQEYDQAEQQMLDIMAQKQTEYSWIANAGASARLNKKKEELAEAEKAYKQAEDQVLTYAHNVSTYEDNLAKFHDKNFSEMSTVTWQLAKDYENAGDAKKAQLEDDIKNTEAYLNILKSDYEKSGKETIKAEIDKNNKILKEQKDELKRYEVATKDGLKKSEIVWSDSLGEQLSEVTGHKVEFEEAGKNNVRMVVDGQKVGAPKSKAEMAKLITDAIKEITKKNDDAKKAGEDLIDGVNNGIKNQNKQNGVFASISNFGSKLLGKLKSSLKERSPSKATEEMGVFLLKGLENGINAETNTVNKQVESFSKNLLKLFSGNSVDYKTSANVLVKSFDSGIESAIKNSKTKVTSIIDTYFKDLQSKNEKQQKDLTQKYEKQSKALQNKVNSTKSKTAKESLKKDLENLKANYKKQLDTLKDQNKEIKTLYNQFGKTAIKEFDSALAAATNGITDNLQNKISELSDKMQAEIDNVNSKIASMKSKLSGYGDLFSTSYDDTGAEVITLADINKQTDTLKKYSSNLNKLKGKVSDELMAEITNMSIDDAIKFTTKLLSLNENQLDEYNKAFINKQQQAAEISNAFYSDQLKKIKENYTDKIKEELNAAKVEIQTIGQQTMEGFIKGMKKSNYPKEIKKIANNLVKQMKKALGIKSPSKVFADQIGKNSALGIEKGFVSEMANVTKEMQAAIPTKLNATVTATIEKSRMSETNDDSGIVNAFKTALSQMKIELDDEVAGEFVERTVTRVVYS